MAVIILRKNVAVVWVTAIASITAPTAAELNGGTRLETVLTTDGLDLGGNESNSDISNLGSEFDTETIGTIGYKPKLKFHQDTTSATIWALFARRSTGFLVVRRGITRATTFATSQGNGGANGTVQVFPVMCGSTMEAAPPGNWDYELTFAMTGDPAERAVVA